MGRVFRRIGRVILGVLTLLVIAFGVLYLINNEQIPKSDPSTEADLLAQKMLKAINEDAYNNTRFFEWSFVGGAHHYKWDKENGKVDVNWDDYTVKLNLNNTSNSIVSKEGITLPAKESRDLTNTARDYFNNDSFWLVAPFKVFDKGTSRSIVKLEDGSNGLLVTYSSGGTTPGDSYLWKLEPNGFPVSFKMWVEIIPIGGVEATWDDWQVMESGVFLPTVHKMGPVTLFIGNVKAYN